MMETLKQKIKNRLEDALLLLCVTDLNFKTELKFEGLIGITLDEREMMMVTIKETVKRGSNNSVSLDLTADVNRNAYGVSVEVGQVSDMEHSPLQRHYVDTHSLSSSSGMCGETSPVVHYQNGLSNEINGVQVHSHGRVEDSVALNIPNVRSTVKPGYLAGAKSLATLSDILQTAKKRSLNSNQDNKEVSPAKRPLLEAIEAPQLASHPDEGDLDNPPLIIQPDVVLKQELPSEWTYGKDDPHDESTGSESESSNIQNKSTVIKLAKIPKLQSTVKVKKALAQMEVNRAEFLNWVNSQFGKFSTVMAQERKDLIIDYLGGGGLDTTSNLNVSRFVAMVREKGYQIVENPHTGDTELALPCRLASGQLVLKLVAAKEEFFDVIARTHLLIDHAGSKRTFRKVYESYCLIPKRAVLRFLQLCPYCKDRSFFRINTNKEGKEKEEEKPEEDSNGLPDSA